MDRQNKLKISTERFEIIAPLLGEGLCAAEIRRLRMEAMEKHEVSERTLRRYLAAYRKKGLLGLEPTSKASAGSFKAIPKHILELAAKYKLELPQRSVRSIITILEKEGHIKKGEISRSTLSHNLNTLGYSREKLLKDSNSKAARRFVRQGRNTLWQSDIKYGPYLCDEKGKKYRTYLATFIDDATRVVCHSEFYNNHRVPILEDCLRKAILKFGKPDAIYVDNGKEYVSRWLRLGCARLAIRHITAKPYSPESKGKIERFNGYADEFMREVALETPKNLTELNRLYQVWLEEAYQHKEHSGIGNMTPMKRFQSDEKRVRFATVEECYDAFLHEETRLVDKTGCFSLSGISYEAGILFARKKIDVRFDPFDLSVVEVWHGGTKQTTVTPLKIGEFSGVRKEEKNPCQIGHSRLLKAYEALNEKRRKNSKGLLSFAGKGDDKDV